MFRGEKSLVEVRNDSTVEHLRCSLLYIAVPAMEAKMENPSKLMIRQAAGETTLKVEALSQGLVRV